MRCSYGAIYVVVDLRPATPTHRNWANFELRDDEQVTFYVPADCAHGFRRSPSPRTCPTRSTALTTRPRTYRSHSMLPGWPSRDRFPRPPDPDGTGSRRHWLPP